MKWKNWFLAGSFAFIAHWLVILLGIFVPFPYAKSYLQLTHTPFDHFLQWDTQWFAAISKYGYNIPLSAQYAFIPSGDHVPFTQLQAAGFFPLVPLLIHVFGLIGALLLGNVVYFSTLLVMSILFQGLLSKKSAFLAILLFATNFTTVYQSSLYAGAYTTLFSVLVIYGVSRSDKLGDTLACLAGLLASFNHEMGILLVVFGFYYLRRRRVRMTLTYGAAVIAGWVVFSTYLWIRFGKPFAMFSAQKVWHRQWVFPGYNWLLGIQHHRSLDNYFVPILVLLMILHIVHNFKCDYRLNSPSDTNILESQEVALWMLGILILGMSAMVPNIPLLSVSRFLNFSWPMFGFLWLKNDAVRIKWMILAIILFLPFSILGSGLYTHGIIFE